MLSSQARWILSTVLERFLMFGVDGRADIILDAFIKEDKDGASRFDIDPEGPDTQFYSQLKEAELINAIGAWGCGVVAVNGVTPAGREHAQKVKQSKLAAGFPILTIDEDALFRECYKRFEEDGIVADGVICEENAIALRRLHQQGLIDVGYADNRPYVLKRITEKGMQYAQDLIPEASNMNVSVSPVFNNSVNSEATAMASVLNSITISSAMRVIEESSLEESEKKEARDALCELEEAAGSKDDGGFLNALEKISGIAKNAADVGNAIIPLVAKLAALFVQ